MSDLETIFGTRVAVYIDYANIYHWRKKLGWQFDIRRMKQFLDSFDSIEKTYFYQWTLVGDLLSESFVKKAGEYGYISRTKPVKIMKLSINASSIPDNSPALLDQFLSRSILRELSVSDIEYFNRRLSTLNQSGKEFVEERKCNFDVEMSLDILTDLLQNPSIDTYILWTGDSDFCDIVKRLLEQGKKVYIFGTSRKISVELANSGAQIYDVQKIRNFLCENKSIEEFCQYKAKGTPWGAPKQMVDHQDRD